MTDESSGAADLQLHVGLIMGSISDWETKKHELITATAFKNWVFIMALKASGRQWRAAK